MKEGYTLYKLIVLYLLDKLKFPLTNGQICVFFAEEEYTDYFTVQETLVDMVESGYLDPEIIRNSTHYRITESGANTLDYFKHEIPYAIRKDIDEYIRKNQFDLREENAVLADYTKTPKNEYIARLIVKEKEDELLNIQITVPLEQQAITICDKWQKKNAQIYSYLIQELM